MSEARNVISSKCAENYFNSPGVHALFFPFIPWRGMTFFFTFIDFDCTLLRVTFVRKLLLEKYEHILSLWPLLLWPFWPEAHPACSLCASAQLCSSGPLIPSLWRQPPCLLLSWLSVHFCWGSSRWEEAGGGKLNKDKSWIWLGEFYKTSVFSANSSQMLWVHNIRC